MSNRLEELIKQEDSLKKQLSENQDLQREEQIAIFLKEKGLKIGGKMRFKFRKDMVLGKILSVTCSGKKPSYITVDVLDEKGKSTGEEKKCWDSAFETIEVV